MFVQRDTVTMKINSSAFFSTVHWLRLCSPHEHSPTFDIKLGHHPNKQHLSFGDRQSRVFCREGINSKQEKMVYFLSYVLVDTVWKKQNQCWKAVSDVDSVFLHTNRCQDSTATMRLIVITKIQHIWRANNQWKFPLVVIILIQQRKLCLNFLGSWAFLHKQQTS